MLYVLQIQNADNKPFEVCTGLEGIHPLVKLLKENKHNQIKIFRGNTQFIPKELWSWVEFLEWLQESKL